MVMEFVVVSFDVPYTSSYTKFQAFMGVPNANISLSIRILLSKASN